MFQSPNTSTLHHRCLPNASPTKMQDAPNVPGHPLPMVRALGRSLLIFHGKTKTYLLMFTTWMRMWMPQASRRMQPTSKPLRRQRLHRFNVILLQIWYPKIHTTPPAVHPQWISLSFALFICLQCAGVHRGFGIQIRCVDTHSWPCTS